MAIDPTENRIAAGDVTGRILIWNSFRDKVPKLQKAITATTAAKPSSTAVADTAMQAAAKEPDAKSDSDSDSDSSDDAQQQLARSSSGQQPVTHPEAEPAKSSNDMNAAQIEAGTAKTNNGADVARTAHTPAASVQRSRDSKQAAFARMQRSTASVPLTTKHWHAHAVGDVCFSADGTLLLSGGEEAVLVSFAWTMAPYI